MEKQERLSIIVYPFGEACIGDSEDKVPDKVTRDLKTDWLSVVLKARAHRSGVAAFCDEQGIEKKLYYRRFRQLRKQHPEWENLKRGRRVIDTGEHAIETKKATRGKNVRRFNREINFAPIKLVEAKTESVQAGEHTVKIVLPNSVVLRVGSACSPEFLGSLVSALRDR